MSDQSWPGSSYGGGRRPDVAAAGPMQSLVDTRRQRSTEQESGEPAGERVVPAPSAGPPETMQRDRPENAAAGDAPAESRRESRRGRKRAADELDQPRWTGTSADLMKPAADPRRELARSGWRGFVRKASLGGVPLKASKSEVAAITDATTVNTEWSRMMTAVVASPKGGAGKTPTTALMAATLGAYRGGAVLAWDNNETMGTLGLRTVPGRFPTTVTTLLEYLGQFETHRAHRGNFKTFVRHQESGSYDALISDEDPEHMAIIGQDEFDRIHSVANQFYDAALVDTGNNIRAANFIAAIARADVLVVPVQLGYDDVVDAGRLFDQLRAQDRADLVENAVVVVTGTRSHDPDAGRWRAWFADHSRAMVDIPYDVHIDEKRALVYDRLEPKTQRAFLRLAAAVADGFTTVDDRSLSFDLTPALSPRQGDSE